MKNLALTRILKSTLFFAVIFLFLSCSGKEAAGTADPSSGDLASAFTSAGMPLLRQTVSARDFSLSTHASAEEVTALSGYRGKVIFLNFWATWCPPCREEMPSMESLYNRFKGNDFEMLAVNIAESDAVVQSFAEEYGLSFPILFDRDSRVGSAYGVQAIPTTFIIDRDGRIVVRFVGGRDWDTPQIRRALEMLINS